VREGEGRREKPPIRADAAESMDGGEGDRNEREGRQLAEA
jgi:hypothetical protein